MLQDKDLVRLLTANIISAMERIEKLGPSSIPKIKYTLLLSVWMLWKSDNAEDYISKVQESTYSTNTALEKELEAIMRSLTETTKVVH